MPPCHVAFAGLAGHFPAHSLLLVKAAGGHYGLHAALSLSCPLTERQCSSCCPTPGEDCKVVVREEAAASKQGTSEHEGGIAVAKQPTVLVMA